MTRNTSAMEGTRLLFIYIDVSTPPLPPPLLVSGQSIMECEKDWTLIVVCHRLLFPSRVATSLPQSQSQHSAKPPVSL